MNVVDTRGNILGALIQGNSERPDADARPPMVLTVAEVATDLRSSKAHVCNIIAGRVKGVAPLAVIRLGRRILIRRRTLEDWKRLNERTATSGILEPSPEVDAVDA